MASPTAEDTRKPESRVLMRGGHPLPLTPETIAQVAELRCLGMSLNRAVSRATGGNTLEWWNVQMQKRPQFVRMYREKESIAVERLLQDLSIAEPGHWQKRAWILERAFPDDYSNKPSAANTQVTVGISIALPDQFRKRALRLINDRGERADVIDVSANIIPGEGGRRRQAAAKARAAKVQDAKPN